MLMVKLSLRVYAFDSVLLGFTSKLIEGISPKWKVVPKACTSTCM